MNLKFKIDFFNFRVKYFNFKQFNIKINNIF